MRADNFAIGGRVQQTALRSSLLTTIFIEYRAGRLSQFSGYEWKTWKVVCPPVLWYAALFS